MNINNGSVYLMVGDLYFGDDAHEVRTLLGSCVAITVWHPRLRHGGMSHIILPEADPSADANALDTRYAGGAIESFLTHLRARGMRPSQYQIGVFGGGQMFVTQDSQTGLDVGMRNIEAVRRLLKVHGFTIDQEEVSGKKYRHVCLNLKTGEVDVRATLVSQTMG